MDLRPLLLKIYHAALFGARLGWQLAFVIKPITSVGIIFLISIPSLARNDIIPGSRYNSPRMLAMGEGGLSLIDDILGGLFYNPSLLAKNKKWVIAEPLALGLGLNMNLFAPLEGYGGYDFYSLDSYKTTLDAHDDLPFYFSGQAASAVSFLKFFHAGALVSWEQNASKDADVGYNYRTQTQLIPVVGFALPLAHGIVNIGYSLQWVNKAEGSVSQATENLSYYDGIAEGSGLSHTAAITLRFPRTYIPTFSFIARNFLNTQYNLPSIFPLTTNSTGAPDTELMSFDAAASVEPRLGASVNMKLGASYRDILDASSSTIFNKIALGVELTFFNVFSARGGMKAGYISYGFGLRTKRGEVELTFYEEDQSPTLLGGSEAKVLLQFRTFTSTGGVQR